MSGWSAKRGTYFGMYHNHVKDTDLVANDIPDIDKVGAGNVRSRADKLLARVERTKAMKKKKQHRSRRQRGTGRRERGVHYTKDGKLVHRDGKSWTIKDEIAQYKKDIEEDEKLVERLEHEDSDLVDTSFEKSLELDELQEDYRRMAGDVQKLFHMIAAEKEKKKKYAADLIALRHEVDATRGLHVIEKERYHQKMLDVKAVEAKLKQQFVADQKAYEEEEEVLDAKIARLTDELEETRKRSVEIERLNKDNEIRTHEISRMKESLEQAKACTLHEAVNAAAIASKEQQEKLHNIIAHLQKELKVTTTMADKLQAEQNILKEELAKAEKRNAVLEQSLLVESEGVSPLALFARKIASGSADGGEELKAAKAKVADLTGQVDTEKAKADELEKQIQQERESHEAAQKAYTDRLGKDIQALKTYIADLDAKVRSA